MTNCFRNAELLFGTFELCAESESARCGCADGRSPWTQGFFRAKNFQIADFTPMRRAYSYFLIAFGFLLGCAQNNYKTTGFPGDQDRFLPASRDYDQRERVDDSMNFSKGNFDPDPDSLY